MKYVVRIMMVLLGLSLLCLAGIYVYRPNITTDALDAEELGEELALQHIPQPAGPHAVRVPILIYHNVRPDFPSETFSQKEYSLTPQMLDAQFAYLRTHGFTVITMGTLVQEATAGTTTPIAKPIVITFDDGWQSQYQYALPILQKYGYIATFYIYTNAISNYPSYMTWQQLQAVKNAGMDIGDHTMSHPYLYKLSTNKRQQEIMGAKQLLEQKIGAQVTSFASPYGYTDAALQQLLKQDGFTTARTTYASDYQSKDDLLKLRGLLVGRSFREFEWYVGK